jgi:hypothetical protein
MVHKQKTKICLFFCLSLIVVTIFTLGCSACSQGEDVTSKVKYLGNPMSQDGQKGRALNVWDLQVFDGKVYVAGGSSITNSGPINVWAYNPKTEAFEQEYTVDEEVIEHFRVIEHELYLPAGDPRNNDANKYYRKGVNSQWRKYSSSSVKLAHVRDLLKTSNGDILLVGNNRQFGDFSKPAIAITSDDGISFSGVDVENIPPMKDVILVDYNWFFSIFSYQNKIYATTALLRKDFQQPGSIAVYDSPNKRFFLDAQLKSSDLIPSQRIKNPFGSLQDSAIYRIWNPVEYQGSLVYPARSYSISQNNARQAYMNSLGLFIKLTPESNPFAVKFPRRKALGEDVIVINNELYALANLEKERGKFIVYVYKTTNPIKRKNWAEVLHFSSSNKARSFEYFNQTFYFGLGQDDGEPVNNSGTIISYQIN